jgi:Polyketide cyclase / dehydrase and lipid transport
MQGRESHEVSVTCRTEMAIPAERAWALVRDFDAMSAWNASVLSSRIEDGPADRVGCTRVLDFGAGGIWVHRLTGLSDEDRVLQYRIVGGPEPTPMGLRDYRSRMQVWVDEDHPDQACVLEWQADFLTDEPQAMRERALQVFETGFAGLRARLGLDQHDP